MWVLRSKADGLQRGTTAYLTDKAPGDETADTLLFGASWTTGFVDTTSLNLTRGPAAPSRGAPVADRPATSTRCGCTPSNTAPARCRQCWSADSIPLGSLQHWPQAVVAALRRDWNVLP